MYWVRRVKAAEVMEEGRPSPLMISCHCFLLITSTRPPLATTRLNNSYRSSTCFAMIGSRLIGVPGGRFSLNIVPVFEGLIIDRGDVTGDRRHVT